MARGCARAHSQTQPAPSMRPETPPPAQLGPRGVRPAVRRCRASVRTCECSIISARNSTGAAASWSWRPARSPARPTAPCWPRYGDTIVLCTAVGVKSSKPGQDFFPLTVNYQEKAFAAGKIPGGFFKREGRPSEAEVLNSPPDRPADPPAVPRGLPQRGPGRRHRAEPRPGERPRHRRPDRLLGRADAVRHPVLRPGRRRPRRLRGRPVHPQPDRRPDRRRSQLDLVVAGTAGRRADGRVRGARSCPRTSCSAPSPSATRASSR